MLFVGEEFSFSGKGCASRLPVDCGDADFTFTKPPIPQTIRTFEVSKASTTSRFRSDPGNWRRSAACDLCWYNLLIRGKSVGPSVGSVVHTEP